MVKRLVVLGSLVLWPLLAGAQAAAPSRVVEPIGGPPLDLAALIANPPLGLGAVPVPASNPVMAARIDLGRKLFYDRRLSFNRTLSCAMCHVPEQGFTQRELRTPVGIEGRFVKRNAPTLLNVAYRRALFHDGRESTLEDQVWQPLLKSNEMANPSIGFVLQTLREAADYGGLFEAAFGRGASAETVGMALASYQRGLLAGDSPFDRWYFGGEAAALAPAAQRGWSLFRDLGCTSCHTVGEDQAQFTDDGFYDTGLGYARSMGLADGAARLRLAPGVEVVPEVHIAVPAVSDLGRYEATGRSADRWRFRVPTLRNVALTAPYMHDGSLPDLDSVVAYYDRGGVPHPGLDPRIRPLGLGAAQRADLVRFLESLTGDTVGQLLRDARSQPIGDAQ
jgi:cytochrome c peroxidase